MIFVWSESQRFVIGGGGTENHTLERARELQRRGWSVKILFVASESYDPGFSDVPYDFVATADLSHIDDTIIYIARGHDIPTIRKSYVFLHFPISHETAEEGRAFKASLLRSKLITNSEYSRNYWANSLQIDAAMIAVVYPFAHPAFATVVSDRNVGVCRVLYPNRITPEKGLFVFLEAAYILKDDERFEFIVMGAGNKTTVGRQTETWLKHVSQITYLQPVATRSSMAEIYARSDIVVVPSRNDYWQEPFGMTSVEGQHAGCRVIASDSGGLNETDCGLLDSVEAGNAYKLAQMIKTVSERITVSNKERLDAARHFTLQRNVDTFLAVIE